MLLGSTVVMLLPDQYEFSARVYADTDSLMGPLLKGIAVQTDPTQQLAVMQATLLSRPNLLKVARSVDADLAAESDVQLEGVLDSIEAHTKVEVSGPKLFKISHSNPDPRRAKDVVQAFLGIFVEGNLGRGREDIESTRDFIDKQIAGYEAQLQATEKRIADFRAKYSDAISSSGTSFSARLEKARADVDELSSEVAAAKNRKLAAQSQKGPQSLETIRHSPRPRTRPLPSLGPISTKSWRYIRTSILTSSHLSNKLLAWRHKMPSQPSSALLQRRTL